MRYLFYQWPLSANESLEILKSYDKNLHHRLTSKIELSTSTRSKFKIPKGKKWEIKLPRLFILQAGTFIIKSQCAELNWHSLVE